MTNSKACLRNTSLFSELSDSDLDLVVASSRERHYPKGNIIFYEGDPGDYLVVVLSGNVKVVLLGDRGQEMILATLGPGNVVGEMALLDGGSRSATVKAADEAVVLLLTRECFSDLILQHPRVMMKVLVPLSRHLREANAKIRSLAMFDVHGRIVRCLLDLSQQRGVRSNDRMVISNSPSHQELAHMIGCARESVTRAMKTLHLRRHITMKGKDIVLEKDMVQCYWDVR